MRHPVAAAILPGLFALLALAPSSGAAAPPSPFLVADLNHLPVESDGLEGSNNGFTSSGTQPVAMAVLSANSRARLLSTGSTPGMPMQTGQVCAFGAAPNCAEQPQNSLDAVDICACTSRPITGSKSP